MIIYLNAYILDGGPLCHIRGTIHIPIKVWSPEIQGWYKKQSTSLQGRYYLHLEVLEPIDLLPESDTVCFLIDLNKFGGPFNNSIEILIKHGIRIFNAQLGHG